MHPFFFLGYVEGDVPPSSEDLYKIFRINGSKELMLEEKSRNNVDMILVRYLMLPNL